LAHPKLVEACIGFVEATYQDANASEARRMCRSMWMKALIGGEQDCTDFMELTARNPRAKGVAAPAIEDVNIAFTALTSKFVSPC
jgi:hypothetical protein